MVDPKILESSKYGSTKERLKEVFTAKSYERGSKTLSRQEKIQINKDIEARKYWEDRIQNRQEEHINFSMTNQHLYGAIDLAWDSAPINKTLYPLMLYAQGRIDVRACHAQLCAVGCKDQFVTKDKDGNILSVDLPKFTDVWVNIVRSVLTRRLAAQCNKYNNLWPFFKYESRSTSQVGKLRADIMSSLADIMADQFDYRAHHEQVYRDTLLYGHSIDFINCAWERDRQMICRAEIAEMSTGESDFDSRIIREGLPWTNPHPTRAFWDAEHPLRTINSDTGCSYIGYWDVVRAGSIRNNPMFWNRDQLHWSTGQAELFTQYSIYFREHFCSIKAPPSAVNFSIGYGNDRKNQFGMYQSVEEDTAMVVTNYFEKIIPSECGLGSYPYPVWMRLIAAGATSIVWAEFLPSTPAAVCSYNENDSRAVNISLAHELLSYQDQMTNLLSYLLLAIKNENVKIVVIDTDILSTEQIQKVREQCRGKNYYAEPIVLEVSRSEKVELGFDIKKAVEIVETKQQAAVDVIFRAMLQLMSLMERLLAMSPQEQGQAADREISATESNAISRTTESVYNYISDSFDAYRAAQKRIIYDSYQAFGRRDFRVPAIGRYTTQTVRAAGFDVADEDQVTMTEDQPRSVTVLGTKEKLVHDYIFTSRDGAERASDVQAAQYLTEALKSILPIPAVQGAMTKNQLFEILNELLRKTGVFDLKLESQDGKGDEPLDGGAGDLQGVLEQITQTLEKQGGEIQQIQQLMAQLAGPQVVRPQPSATAG